MLGQVLALQCTESKLAVARKPEYVFGLPKLCRQRPGETHLPASLEGRPHRASTWGHSDAGRRDKTPLRPSRFLRARAPRYTQATELGIRVPLQSQRLRRRVPPGPLDHTFVQVYGSERQRHSPMK